MEAFIREHKAQVQDLGRPQELGIFHESAEIEQKTSKMGSISIKI